MQYAKNILEIVGNTPLVKLNVLSKGLRPTILVKLEYLNPGGSIKDRIGMFMIADAEKKGLIKKGWTIVEPTSGNTGVGLAMVAAIRGYKVVFTVPDKVSIEKQRVLETFGAKVIKTPTNVSPDDPKSYYGVAKKLVKEIGTAYSPNQYHSKANMEAHYQTTGPEIWRDTNGKVTHVIVGMGTTGTIMGIAKFLKKKSKRIQIVGVDPEGSMFHHEFYKTKGEIHQYKVEGIGEDFMPKILDMKFIDKIVVTHDKESFITARELAKKEGIFAGGSSGAAVFAALKIAKKLPKSAVIVVILPDSGRNYISKFYDDTWMKENKFL